VRRTFNTWALTALIAATGTGTLTGCAVNPVTGQRQLALITEGQEIELGRQVAAEAVATMGLVDDQALQQYVSGLGMRMARTSERPNLPWSFQVVDDPTPNAFAAPGGFIFVTRGLLSMLRSEAELVAVLGHEIGHVTARHSVTALSRAQVAQIGLGLGAILSPTVARFGDLLGGGMQLLFLSYGRDAERQADDLGFRYMLEHSFDAREMIKVFAALQRSGELAGQSPVPSWLATHPYPGERIERIQGQLATLGQDDALARTRIGTEDYLNRIGGLIFGENPRNGFFQQQQYLHPEMRFRINFPAQWRLQNTAQAVIGVAQQQDAIMQLTLAQGTEAEAADRFFRQQGIAATQVGRQTINGLPAVTGFFEARTQDGTIRGFAGFIRHDNRTYQILGYAPAAAFARHDASIRASIGSFAVLTDAAALNVRPNRIAIVRVPQPMTLAQFQQQFPSQTTMEQLAIINHLAGPTTTVPAGYLMKRVVAGP
jgi:predicted Zn-dependent protease